MTTILDYQREATDCRQGPECPSCTLQRAILATFSDSLPDRAVLEALANRNPNASDETAMMEPALRALVSCFKAGIMTAAFLATRASDGAYDDDLAMQMVSVAFQKALQNSGFGLIPFYTARVTPLPEPEGHA